MDISEIGMSKQIRILIDDADWLEKQKLVPEEPWYKVFSRLRMEYEAMRKNAKMYKEIIGKRGSKNDTITAATEPEKTTESKE